MIDLDGKKTFEIKCMMRSGSTLLSKLFDSHPDILSLSETRPKKANVDPVVYEAVTHVCAKRIYTSAHPVPLIEPNLGKQIYLLRGPYTQLASLRKMRQKTNPTEKQIERRKRAQLVFKQNERLDQRPKQSEEDIAYNTALNTVVMYNAMLVDMIKNTEPAYVIWYEDLVENSVEVMDDLFDFVGVKGWTASVLLQQKIGRLSGDPTARKSTELNSPKETDERYKDILDNVFGINNLMARFPKSGLLEREAMDKLRSNFTPLLEGE